MPKTFMEWSQLSARMRTRCVCVWVCVCVCEHVCVCVYLYTSMHAQNCKFTCSMMLHMNLVDLFSIYMLLACMCELALLARWSILYLSPIRTQQIQNMLHHGKERTKRLRVKNDWWATSVGCRLVIGPHVTIINASLLNSVDVESAAKLMATCSLHQQRQSPTLWSGGCTGHTHHATNTTHTHTHTLFLSATLNCILLISLNVTACSIIIDRGQGLLK